MECKYFGGYDPSGIGTDIQAIIDDKEYGACMCRRNLTKKLKSEGHIFRVLHPPVRRYPEDEEIRKPAWCRSILATFRIYCNK